jgi:indolepyruvate ferredoxin oxidoreductase
MIEGLLAHLDDSRYDLAVQMAELPDGIRGYENIKLASVSEFRRRVEDLQRQIQRIGTGVGVA